MRRNKELTFSHLTVPHFSLLKRKKKPIQNRWNICRKSAYNTKMGRLDGPEMIVSSLLKRSVRTLLVLASSS